MRIFVLALILLGSAAVLVLGLQRVPQARVSIDARLRGMAVCTTSTRLDLPDRTRLDARLRAGSTVQVVIPSFATSMHPQDSQASEPYTVPVDTALRLDSTDASLVMPAGQGGISPGRRCAKAGLELYLSAQGDRLQIEKANGDDAVQIMSSNPVLTLNEVPKLTPSAIVLHIANQRGHHKFAIGSIQAKWEALRIGNVEAMIAGGPGTGAATASLESGAITYEDSGGAKVELPKGGMFRLAADGGDLSITNVRDGVVIARFDGQVTELRAGPDASDDLMPSRLLRLTGSKRLAAILIAAFGIIAAVGGAVIWRAKT